MKRNNLSLSPTRQKNITAAFLISLLLITFTLMPVAFAESTAQDITVDTAYRMIRRNRFFPDLVILDVRNQSEYYINHLYGAVLIPLHELEARIGELAEQMDNGILVYCSSGDRSEAATGILVGYGFTKVYNMLGGITAWIESGYPVYTTFHNVTVDITGNKGVHAEIKPLLPQMGCTSCCENQECPDESEITNIQSTVLEEEKDFTATLITYEVEGTTFEVTITKRLLWSYSDHMQSVSKAANFTLIEINIDDISIQVYSLNYVVQHAEYNLTIFTALTPLNSETYNSSFTVMDYAPAGKSELISLELVESNSSVTLSTQYAVLGKVAKELGKNYKKSKEETLIKLAQGYYTIEKEAKHLAKLVKKQLQEYDRTIPSWHALINDKITACIFPMGIYSIVFYCLDPLQPSWVIEGACCATLYAIVVGAAAACVGTGGIGCLLAIAAGIATAWASLAGCYTVCPSMQVCVTVFVLWWSVDLVCIQAW